MSEHQRFYLTFPRELIKEPVIYQVGHKFKVVTNIRQATISEDIGLVALELEGEEAEVERAVNYLREVGVKVEPIELSVVEG